LRISISLHPTAEALPDYVERSLLVGLEILAERRKQVPFSPATLFPVESSARAFQACFLLKTHLTPDEDTPNY
jgi:hypothetical protein